MTLQLPPEILKKLQDAFELHCREHLDLTIGELQGQRLIELVLGVVGPLVYNQAIQDAQGWMQTKLLDLEGDLHVSVSTEG